METGDLVAIDHGMTLMTPGMLSVHDRAIGIACLAPDGTVQACNAHLPTMLHLPIVQITGHHFADLFTPPDAINRTLLADLLSGRHESLAITAPLLRDHQPYCCRITGQLLRDAAGAPIGATVQLDESIACGELGEARSRFLAVLSHELRTPLTNIMGWAEAALEAPDVMLEAMRIILRNAQHQHRMLNNLLEISRMVHHHLMLRREPVDLWQVAVQACRAWQNTAEAREVRLVLRPPGQPLIVLADAKRLMRMIDNLLDNAIKFTPPGGLVTLSAWPRDSEALLEIHDSGAGMRSEQMTTLFQAFVPDRACVDGLHLGLAVVKHLAELHGGTITADSGGEGQGSRFTLRLPCLLY